MTIHMAPPDNSWAPLSMRPFSLASSSPSSSSIWLDRGGGEEGGDAAASGGGEVIEKEHMFDKVVTPSDVGKLNRLVIPKQHAERYFPLDSSNNEKGLLLNFEDRNGKPWRFRYSYWNSSQSYVMTKGWSRFVKEKKLDAGDIVSFQRGAAESYRDRLFIDWRRRPENLDQHHRHNHHNLSSIPAVSLHHHLSFPRPLNQYTWNYHTSNQLLSPPARYSYGAGSHQNPAIFGPGAVVVNGNPCPSGTSFLRPMLSFSASAASNQRYHHEITRPKTLGVGSGYGGEGAVVYESFPVVEGKAAAKRLRLFGVNMDCPIEAEENDIVLSSSPSSSSTAAANSSSIATSLQLKPYSYGDDDEFRAAVENKPNKSLSSSMSLDLDI